LVPVLITEDKTEADGDHAEAETVKWPARLARFLIPMKEAAIF
jgi:hypothetical protein